MKTSLIGILPKKIETLAVFGGVGLAVSVQASTDYGPAIYRPMSGCSKWYTSGNGHHFAVIHDMEGYYWSTISYLNNCSVSVSIHYMANGKQDTSTDAPAGELTQSVREANYAWHARCWNTWMFGTEHEGFASNPAWYTEQMYQASSGLQDHLASAGGFATDRNHIIGHNEHNNANWRNWVSANYPSLDPNCNTHSDPGVYWDWSHFMALVNPQNPPWLFPSSTQGWITGHSTTAPYQESCCGWSGVLVTDQNGDDGYIYSPPTRLSAPGYSVVNVNVYPQNGTTANHDMQMFFKNLNENSWTADKSSPVVNYTAQNAYTTLNLDVNASGKFSGNGITQMRLDFDQVNHGTRWIINHIVLQSSFNWTFSADAQGWTPGHSLSAITWTACCGWPGIIYADQTGDDAYMYADSSWFDVDSGHPYNFLGGANDRVHVRVYPQNGNTANHDMRLYWISTADSVWSDSKSVLVNYTAQNAWADVYIPVGTNSLWPAAHITRIRLDFDAINHGNRWIVDSIKFEH